MPKISFFNGHFGMERVSDPLYKPKYRENTINKINETQAPNQMSIYYTPMYRLNT